MNQKQQKEFLEKLAVGDLVYTDFREDDPPTERPAIVRVIRTHAGGAVETQALHDYQLNDGIGSRIYLRVSTQDYTLANVEEATLQSLLALCDRTWPEYARHIAQPAQPQAMSIVQEWLQ